MLQRIHQAFTLAIHGKSQWRARVLHWHVDSPALAALKPDMTVTVTDCQWHLPLADPFLSIETNNSDKEFETCKCISCGKLAHTAEQNREGLGGHRRKTDTQQLSR